MKRVFTLVILMAIVACSLVPVAVLAEVSDPVGVSSSLFNISTDEGGEAVVTLSVTNALGRSIDVEVTSWPDYSTMGADDYSIDSEWVTSVSPSEQTIPVGGAMTTNVVYDIPKDAPEVRYKTWLQVKVLDYPQKGGAWSKPVTVVIRKGQAATATEFSVYPAYYRMLVDRYNAHLTVTTAGENEYTTYTTIRVNNKCAVNVEAYATAEDRGENLVIEQGSTISHTDEEVGTVYKNVSAEQAEEWFRSPYTKENPLVVPPNKSGSLTWSVDVPDSLGNGHYVFAVRVASLGSSGWAGSVNVNYVIWMLFDVQRETKPVNWTVVVFGLLGFCLFAVVAGPPVVKRLRKRTQDVNG